MRYRYVTASLRVDSGECAVMDGPSNPKRRKQLRPDERICPHCDQIVSYKTYRMHRQLYFNIDSSRWFRDIQSSTEDEVVMSEVDRVDENMVSEPTPGEGMYPSDEIDLSPPPADDPHCSSGESASEESPPLSEPGSTLTSGSCLTTDGKQCYGLPF